MSKEFLKGNEALAEAAVRAGCRFFAGYPITPQNEVPEYLSWRLPEVGGVFIQGESEVASIYMVYGAASTGRRSMTSSSGPGISLKTEGITYLAAAQLPAVIVDMQRGGPAIGQVTASQQDYLFVTRGAGPGGIRCFTFAPSTVQELVDHAYRAFDVADEYRAPVFILADAVIGNMMENVELPPMRELSELPDHDDWKLTKRGEDGKARIVQTYNPVLEDAGKANQVLADKYQEWEDKLQEWEEYMLDDAEYVIVAYGTTGRIAKSAVNKLRSEGIKAGLLRPVVVYPFPKKAFEKLDYSKVKFIVDAEMSIPAQLLEDVKLSVGNAAPIYTALSSGGVLIKESTIINTVKENM
ncbi:MAG: 3-methyl-2-oxobutanoate dehydrogenase subunit VorB [Oscillospiraceae bacterium]|nr:3-methyl-2-oxobutanoate dehydrogenase subunit VorB [Oscillospiraceae bacterium]